jgi:hypothetical protein
MPQHTYRKISDDLFLPERDTPNPVSLMELKNELEEMKASKGTEPTDAELIEWAKQNHPYYEDDARITELEEFVNYLESL